MPLSIIAGKPGSGKSYHMSKLLVDMLEDWVRHELKKGKPYDSSVWLNITLKLDGLNETISKRVGQEVDVSHYIYFCDASFFNDSEKTYWWEKFPAKSVIVIDEVHVYLGKSVECGSLDLEQALINWISQHRHTQQVVYFLSQHTDQFARQILGVADLLLEIVNMKSLVLPWPISVRVSDIDEVKRAWGIKTQYYQANVGNFRGKAVRWSGATERYMMSEDIFRVYKSHDSGMEESDRPSLEMTKWESLKWFARRHAWHLVPKVAGILSVPLVLGPMLLSLPNLLMAAATPDHSKEREKSVVVEMVAPVSREVSLSGGLAAIREPVEVAVVTALPQVAVKSKKIVMLFNGGLMCDDGSKIAIGETVDYEDKTETLLCACAVCGVIGFASGKRIRF